MTPDIKQRIEQVRQGEVPEEYKKTKAGIMPEEWEEKFIKDISSDICAGATPETKVLEYWKNGTIPWLASGEIHKRRIYQTEKSITEKGYLSSSTKMIPENCVLIALAGQGKTRGTVAVNKIPLCTNQSIAAIIPNNCYYQYLYYFLDIRYNNLREISSGDGTRGGLNLNLIANYPVTIPPLPEQEKIAAILTTQDRVIELKQQLLAQKQQQKKYLMQQLLTGKKRLPGFSGEWKKVRLHDLCTYMNEHSVGSSTTYVSTENMLPNLSSSVIFETEDYPVTGIKYQKGDILIGNIRPYLKKIWLADRNGICSTDVLVLHTHSNTSADVYNFIATDNFFSYIMIGAKGSKMPRGDKKHIMDYQLFMSNSEVEKESLSQVLFAANHEIELLQQNIEQEKQKKKALMQLLLTGIVRVSV